MQKLVDGIHHFKVAVFSARREEFERLLSGQHPHALFITCSDSRINTSLITQTEPGDLFVLRNAGNIIPAHGATQGGEAGTIEFAVTGLGITDIVVCGHTHCGAMKGLLEPDTTANMPAVAAWLGHAAATRRIILENYKHLSGPALLTATVEENVLVQIENLKTHPVVAAGLSRRSLRLHGWVYKMETGEVFAYDSELRQFAPLVQAKPVPGGLEAVEGRRGAAL